MEECFRVGDVRMIEYVESVLEVNKIKLSESAVVNSRVCLVGTTNFSPNSLCPSPMRQKQTFHPPVKQSSCKDFQRKVPLEKL